MLPGDWSGNAPRPYIRPAIFCRSLIRLFEEHRVTGILADSRPNDGTRALVEARPTKLRVVPFLRPYRVRDDVHRWFRDPATLELIDSEFRRGDYIGIGGQLTPEWRALFERYADRFLLGSDTWTNERWDAYGATMATYRAWLAQLPPEPAAMIASGNGLRLFGR